MKIRWKITRKREGGGRVLRPQVRGLDFRSQGLYKVQGCVGSRVPEEVLLTRRLGQAVYTDITQRDDV